MTSRKLKKDGQLQRSREKPKGIKRQTKHYTKKLYSEQYELHNRAEIST